MASLVIVPASEAFFPTTYQCCPYSGGFRHFPVRHRNQSPRISCRSPASNSVSRLLDQVERERYLENLCSPTLLFHLKKRRSDEKEENSSATGGTDKQPSDKTEETVSPKEEKVPEKFSVSLELGDSFEPSEISVKLIGKSLQIEGKHEERGDDGHFSCRQFSQSFYLPDDVDIENLTSTLSTEGVLSVEAPRLQLKQKEPEERNIPIQQTAFPEAVEGKKSDEASKETNEEEKKNEEAGKSEEEEWKEHTANQPEAAEPIRENSE